MLWFKNAIVYQFSKEMLFNQEQLENALRKMAFTPCGSQDLTKLGWISPYGDENEHYVLAVEGHFLIRAKKERKMLPSSVIKQALQVKIEKLEKAQQRKLKKIEKDALKDEVLIDLLPRAFSQYRYYWLWIDTENQRIIADASSYKQAEDIIALLRKSVGSLPLTPWHYDTPLERLLTKWVKNNSHLPPFILGDEAELKDPLEGNGIIRCKQQELTTEEIIIHIDSGKQITKLKLIQEETISFILQSDMTIKRIQYDPILLDKNEDIDRADVEKRLEADFFIQNNTLINTLNNLYDIVKLLDIK